jgi:hypothetical protein
LWIVAGVSAAAGLVAIGIVVTRDVRGTDLDQLVLRTVGLTRAERMRVPLPRALLIAAAGAVLAAVGALVLSPRFPVGLARQADPDVGVHADWTVLVPGVAALGFAVLGIAAVAAVRASRTTALDRELHAYRWTSNMVERAARTGLRPTAVNGIRMAVQTGHGERALPVRSALMGTVLGVVGVSAALVFAASLSHLVTTPRLYGWTWDVSAEVPTDEQCGDTGTYGLDPREAEAIGFLCSTYTGVELDGRHTVTVTGFRSVRGSIEPEVVAGRAPRGDREIALGSVTLDGIGKGIGDSVRARGLDRTVEYRIVGQIVLPTVGAPQALADGAMVTAAGFAPLQESGENETHHLAVRAAPDTDPATILQRVRGIDQVQNVRRTTLPVEITRLRQIDAIPAALAALLGILALVAVTHAVVSTIRRRRGELALLKVLGFTRGQVRATIAWQTTVLGAIGLLVGVPLGVVVGRGAWQLVAEGLGVTPSPIHPAVWLLVTVPVALVIVNLVAVLPARTAARTLPSVALREA